MYSKRPEISASGSVDAVPAAATVEPSVGIGE